MSVNLAESRAMELVAIALSEEYGVRVICDGIHASTKRDSNGNPVITIPAIPLEDPNYRLLVRGYVDHEAGHVRFSDLALIDKVLLENARIAGALKAVNSIYEDVRVDRLMSECFTGCRRNLRKLCLFLYNENAPPVPDAEEISQKLAAGIIAPREIPWRIWNMTLMYLLYAARTPGLPQLEPLLVKWRQALDLLAPGLPAELEPFINVFSDHGISGPDTLELACKTVGTIEQYFLERLQCEADFRASVLDELPWLFRNGGDARDQMDMSSFAGKKLDEILLNIDETQFSGRICFRHETGSELWRERVLPLSGEEREEALKWVAKMAAQMRALLQSHVINREGLCKKGRLHTRQLHKLFIGRDDLFQRNVERRKINTEIVICMDMSGSMRFDGKALMASKALYAVADSLASIQGLHLNILGFFDNSVVEIFKPGSPLTPIMKIVPDGGTQCGAAIREAAQNFSPGSQKRRLIMMITDGDANDPEDFTKAIADLRAGGFEFLGIGIRDRHLLDYFASDECCVIEELKELAAAILGLLSKKMGLGA